MRCLRWWCSMGGGGEAELHAVGILLVGPLYLRVVDHHESLAGLLHVVKLHQPTDALVTLGWEPFDFVWSCGALLNKQSLHLLVFHLWDVVEM